MENNSQTSNQPNKGNQNVSVKNKSKIDESTSENLKQVLISCLKKNENKIFPSQNRWNITWNWIYLIYVVYTVAMTVLIIKVYPVISIEQTPNLNATLTSILLLVVSAVLLVIPVTCLRMTDKPKENRKENDLPYIFLQHIINTLSDLEKLEEENKKKTVDKTNDEQEIKSEQVPKTDLETDPKIEQK